MSCSKNVDIEETIKTKYQLFQESLQSGLPIIELYSEDYI